MIVIKQKKGICFLLAFLLTFSFSFVTAYAKEEKTVTILHTNDMHGSMVSSSSTIGADLVATVKKEINNTILVDAGDATQGSSLATLTQGEDVIGLMNAAGYDVMTAGNHEFDYGADTLLKNAESADFPILSANVKKDGGLLFKNVKYADGTKTNNGENIIIEKNGVKVGFFGITTAETAVKSNPKGLKGITFDDEVKTSKEQVKKLKEEGADVIVGIMHMGVDPSSKVTSKKIAEALKGTDLNIIIDGHSHTVMTETVGDIVINQTGTGSKNIGKIDITLGEGRKVQVDASLLNAETVIKDFEPSAEITKQVEEITKSQSALLSKVVGKTKTSLWGGTINGVNEARIGETNLGSLVADSMAWGAKNYLKGTDYEGKPVVALQNGGGVRATIKAGNITSGDVLNVLPFGNTLAFKSVTPSILYEAIENGVSKVVKQDSKTGLIEGAPGAFPQISGMKIEYNPDLEVGKRVTAIYLDGSKELLDRNDKKTEIILASNDFEIAGGDGYSMLVGLKSVGEGQVLDQIFQQYITQLSENGTKPIEQPIITGRIKTVGAYQPTNYDAKIVLKDVQGNAIAGLSVEYSVDGKQSQVVLSQADGSIEIKGLTDGPHGITINGEPEVLVNNYSGAGIKTEVSISLIQTKAKAAA